MEKPPKTQEDDSYEGILYKNKEKENSKLTKYSIMMLLLTEHNLIE